MYFTEVRVIQLKTIVIIKPVYDDVRYTHIAQQSVCVCVWVCVLVNKPDDSDIMIPGSIHRVTV